MKRMLQYCIAFAMVVLLFQPSVANAEEMKNKVDRTIAPEYQVIPVGDGAVTEDGTSFETAYSLTTGTMQIHGETYVKYVNNTGSGVQLNLWSSDNNCDPYLYVYKLEGDEYVAWGTYDDDDYDNDFEFVRELADGDTVYFRVTEYEYKEDEGTNDFSYTLNTVVTAIKEIESVTGIASYPENSAYEEFMQLYEYSPSLTGLTVNVKYDDGTAGTVVYGSIGDWGYNTEAIKPEVGTYPIKVTFSYLGKVFNFDVNVTVKSLLAESTLASATVNTLTTTAYNNDKYVAYAMTIPTSGYYNLYCETGSYVEFFMYDSNNRLAKFSDYFYYDGINTRNYLAAGTYYMFVNVEEKGKSATWKLSPGTDANMEGLSTNNIPIQLYTGKEITPEISLMYKGNDVTTYKDRDGDPGTIKCYYYGNVNPGTATVKIGYDFCVTDEGWHNGYYYTTFNICKPITGATVTVSNLVYTGTPLVPATTVTMDGKTLELGKDYKVTADSNVNAGVKTLTIEGIGIYTGQITQSYTIVKAEQTIDVADEFVKNKSSKKFVLNAKAMGALTYQTSNKKIATVDNKGAVKLKKKYGVANITINAAATENYNAASRVVKVIVTSKATKIASVKSTTKKKAAVKIKRAAGAQGYEISYSMDKEFKTGVKTTTSKKTTATLKKLKGGKTYYVRVRSYRKVGGKKLYSEYSAAKSVKIKK